MPDRIYVTYTPTTAPGTFHTAIHYERADSTGKLVRHVVVAISSGPEDGNNPQASAPDAGAAPLVPSNGRNSMGGLAGRIAALAGIDPQNPDQLAPPPPDRDLRGYYYDDPTQPWLVRALTGARR